MELLAILLMIIGLILFPVGLIWSIIAVIRKRKKKSALLAIVFSVIIFIVGGLIMPTDDYFSTSDGSSDGTIMPTDDYSSTSEGSSDGTNSVNNANVYSNTEIFASEFCMAYMNSLKNPYSFKVKYIWANDVGNGEYEVYVKFTAENSFGAEVADEIATMSSLDSSELKKLSQGGDYVNIYTWVNEPTGKILGQGTDLDASKIQAYIDKNYK